MIPARNEHKKGRAKEGFITGVRKCFVLDKNRVGILSEEGLVKSEIKIRGNKITAWSVYNSGNNDNIWKKLDEEGLIIGGNFNIRIGERGTNYNLDQGIGLNKRVSNDKTISNGGKKMIEFIEEKGWVFLNGRTGNFGGDFTFIERPKATQ